MSVFNIKRSMKILRWFAFIIALALVVAMMGPAIKFGFRILLELMNHPLEALCFTALGMGIIWVLFELEEKENGKV